MYTHISIKQYHIIYGCGIDFEVLKDEIHGLKPKLYMKKSKLILIWFLELDLNLDLN